MRNTERYYPFRYLTFRQTDRHWQRFMGMCRSHLQHMSIYDMDRFTLQRVVDTCKDPHDVWRVVNLYHETYFRELLQTLEIRSKPRACLEEQH